MKVTGFSFIRNAEIYDYPIVEAIKSILPLCQKVVVAVGNSDDNTRQLVASIHPKVEIIDTVWDESLREGGRVLSAETNKALQAIEKDTDWAVYVQGDEVYHENSLDAVQRAMETFKSDDRVEGLIADYLHFYGSYDFVGDSPRWYRREVRIIKPLPGIISCRDAQSFRYNGVRKLRVKHSGGRIHHYGWVKNPVHQQQKQLNFNKLWHSDQWIGQNIPDVDTFDYGNIDALKRFQGEHPEVMNQRIQAMNWNFTFDPSQRKLPLKYRLKLAVEKITGIRPGEHKNYRLL
jgi:glycosyltransferase involved in cell wall biosynthesis